MLRDNTHYFSPKQFPHVLLHAGINSSHLCQSRMLTYFFLSKETKCFRKHFSSLSPPLPVFFSQTYSEVASMVLKIAFI